MKTLIYTDSAADFSASELKKYDIGLIPMPVTCNDTTYIDDRTIPMDFFWKKILNKEDVKTSQPSQADLIDAFERAKSEGKAIIYICLSSKISGTYQGALLAKSLVEYDHIYIVDGYSAAASAAEKILTIYACMLRNVELPADEIASKLNSFKSRIKLYACIDTLEYLARGGRLNKTLAVVGNLVGLKPIISFGLDGEIKVLKKVLGTKKAIREIQALMDNPKPDTNFPIIPLYSYNNENCLDFINEVHKTNPELPIKKLLPIGATIGTYIGPGGFGIAFVEEAE